MQAQRQGDTQELSLILTVEKVRVMSSPVGTYLLGFDSEVEIEVGLLTGLPSLSMEAKGK